MAVNPFGQIDLSGVQAPTTSRIMTAPGSVPPTTAAGNFAPITPQTPVARATPTQGPTQAQPQATYAPLPATRVSTASAAFAPGNVTINGSKPYNYTAQPGPVLQDPGNNWTNPGYGEQALQATQNTMLNDPFASQTQGFVNQASSPSQGENYLNQNLGSLQGPGQGQQYWNQVSGQFSGPTAGQTYTQNATNNLPNSSSAAFYDQAMGNYPSAGQYGGPNYSAQQYGATQGAFGDLPLPTSADSYYDRSEQLGVQAYNQDAASRGVYGSSETLSGVGNVVSNIEAARAQNAFQNQMSIDQEQRQREALLGTQAQAADTTGISAFNAGTQATQTYGNLASQADTQNTNQYTAATTAMNNADQTATNRMNVGGQIAQNVDQTNTNNYNAQAAAATNAGQLDTSRISTGADIAGQGSRNDLARQQGFNNAAQGAENQRQSRQSSAANMVQNLMNASLGQLSDQQKQSFANNETAFNDWFNATIAPQMNAANISQADIDAARQQYWAMVTGVGQTVNSAASTASSSK